MKILEYISAPETAKKWGISERRVQKLCEENRIPDVAKFSRLWLRPKDVEKPIDKRCKTGKKKMSKILLLEDDLSLINGLTFAFQKAGFELDIARAVKEVDTAWMEGKYDLLILDTSLPDGSGFEIRRKVRRHQKY